MGFHGLNEKCHKIKLKLFSNIITRNASIERLNWNKRNHKSHECDIKFTTWVFFVEIYGIFPWVL